MLTMNKEARTKVFLFSALEEYLSVYTNLQEFANESKEEMLAVAESLQYRDLHSKADVELKKLIIPSTQEELKSFYTSIILKFLERFAPHFPMQVNDNAIRVRIDGPMMQRIRRIADDVYEKDPYWGEFFNREYPRFASLLSRQKRCFASVPQDKENIVYKEVINEREHLVFNISERFVQQDVFPSVSRIIEENRLMTADFNLGELDNALRFFSSTLTIWEMYEGMKNITTAHAQKSQQNAMENFTRQYQSFISWYRENKIFTLEQVAEVAGEELKQSLVEKGITELVVRPSILPQVPKNMELLLYENESDSDDWFATIMEPASTLEDLSARQHAGYKAPVIGKVTGFNEEKEEILINDFFSIKISEDFFIESITKHTPEINFNMHLSEQDREQYDEISRIMLGIVTVKDEIEETPEEQPEEESKETLTLEELMARHGITPEEKVTEEVPVQMPESVIRRQQARTEANVIRIFPDNYRVTKTGDTFMLYFQNRLYVSLSSEELKQHLVSKGILAETPAMINIDFDMTHHNTLEQPFVNLQRYLVM